VLKEEHKAILRDALLPIANETRDATFESYLRQMPDVGADSDFSMIEGSIGDVNLIE
jgi:hypothetical protein